MDWVYKNYLPDGALEQANTYGDYDLTLSSGQHIRGTAEDLPSAIAAMATEYTADVMRRWNQGLILSGGRFVCPIE